MRKISCYTLSTTYQRAWLSSDTVDTLWRIIAEDQLDVAEAALDCLSGLGNRYQLYDQMPAEDLLSRLITTYRKRPALVRTILSS